VLVCQDCLKVRALLVAAVVAGSFAFATVAVGQTTLPGPGSRVRVTAPDYDMRQATGRVLRRTEDSITIDRDGARPDVTLPFDRLSRLDVSTGKLPSHGFFRGAALGLVVGLFAGAAYGGLQYLSCSGELCGIWILVGGAVGAGAGLIVGAIVGVPHPPDRWERVALPGRSSGAGGASGGRTAKFGLSISFR